MIRNNCGEYTFMEAFEYTGRIINITVAPANKYDPPRLLNYITAPHVLVWSAALASSCIPGVFEPQCLQVKESNGTIRAESATGRTFTDGSVECDLPMSQLSELFNINNFIVSQVCVRADCVLTVCQPSAKCANFVNFTHERENGAPEGQGRVRIRVKY